MKHTAFGNALQKPFGRSMMKGQIKGTKPIVPDNKKPVYIPELKFTVMLAPGADVAAIVKKYQDAKEFKRKSNYSH